MSIFRLSYVILPVLLTGWTAVAAEREASVRQDWCGDGVFRVVVEEVGIGIVPDGERCFALTSSGFTVNARPRLSRYVSEPVGSSIDFALAEALGRKDLSYRDVPTANERAFVVRSVRCGTHDMFKVETVAHAVFPVLLNEAARASAEQCAFDVAGTGVRVTSRLDIAGLYARVHGTSVADFARTLTAR